jgi:hypothetical protein
MATFFNRILAANYATRFAPSGNYNPTWLADEEDCTNFVSQALYAGGWTMTAGRGNDDETAWYNTGDADSTILGRSHFRRSRSWGAAENFRQYLQCSGRARSCAIAGLTFGDVVQHYVNGQASHTMMITGFMPSSAQHPATAGLNGVVLLASYHSKDKANTPLTILNPPNQNLFWKILDTFSDTMNNPVDRIIANVHTRWL